MRAVCALWLVRPCMTSLGPPWKATSSTYTSSYETSCPRTYSPETSGFFSSARSPLGDRGRSSGATGKAAPIAASRCARIRNGMFPGISCRAAAELASEGPSSPAQGGTFRSMGPCSTGDLPASAECPARSRSHSAYGVPGEAAIRFRPARAWRGQDGEEPADRNVRHKPVRRVRCPGNRTKRTRFGKASGYTHR
jgi:hypothetical protein